MDVHCTAATITPATDKFRNASYAKVAGGSKLFPNNAQGACLAPAAVVNMDCKAATSLRGSLSSCSKSDSNVCTTCNPQRLYSAILLHSAILELHNPTLRYSLCCRVSFIGQTPRKSCSSMCTPAVSSFVHYLCGTTDKTEPNPAFFDCDMPRSFVSRKCRSDSMPLVLALSNIPGPISTSYNEGL